MTRMSGEASGDELVWGVVDRLQRETDPIRKYALRSLLIEQEDAYGTAAERLDRADAHIAAGHFKIAELEHATAALRARGRNVDTAERIIENLRELLVTFGSYRELVLEELGRRAF
jgi:hypothetical protein